MADPIVPLVKKVNITPIQQRIQAVNDDKTLSNALHGDLNRLIAGLGNALNYNADTVQIIVDTLAGLGILVQRVEAVAAAQAASAAAQAATAAEQALINSYTDPTLVLSAMTASDGATASITVINHNRIYADVPKTSVPVIGKMIPGLAINTVYYLYYDDAARAGGAVDIKISTNNLDAAQTGIRHSLGSIQTGGATDTTPTPGGGVNPPGGNYRDRSIPNVNIE